MTNFTVDKAGKVRPPKASARKSETFRVFLLLFKPVAFDFLVSFVVLAVAQARL